MKRYYTIGMAGHIDHGKTTLTKALTNIDTDRLQEEKTRAISIEPGFAPLVLTEDLEVSVVDVPGHEKFIRQMIAGVAGIDAVILVVAADEGFMPQTKEHLHILHLLGIQKGLIAVTKSAHIEEEMKELIQEDIIEHTEGTFLENSGIYFVDSIDMIGLDELNSGISRLLESTRVRKAGSGFRMPIDQSFSVKGHGTVVRGTIFDGSVSQGDTVTLLPQNMPVRIKQLQVHHETKDRSFAGQRAALNLTGISYEKVSRGDVLVKGSYPKTNVIDISLVPVPLFNGVIKQRTPVKIHIGTSEVYGKIVFFDRNELSAESEEEILCQIRLDEEIIALRNDRLILRRPSPAETIGGGMVIDPQGGKYRFGEKTVSMLLDKKEGTPLDRMISLLSEEAVLSEEELLKKLSITKEDLHSAEKSSQLIKVQNWWILSSGFSQLTEQLTDLLDRYHKQHSLREGKDIADIHQELNIPAPFAGQLVAVLEEKEIVYRNNMNVYLPEFTPGYPAVWAKRMEQAEVQLLHGKLQPAPFKQVLEEKGIPAEYHQELRKFWTRTTMQELDEKHLIAKTALEEAVAALKKDTGTSFTLQEAKQTLQLSRKYLVPVLELLDSKKITKREENVRTWT